MSISTLKSIIFTFIALIAFSFSATADGGNCNKNFYFSHVNQGDTYRPGKNLYVKVNAQNYRDIANMTLYINGRKISTDTSAPFEWARPNSGTDNYLRNLKAGNYTLKCVVKTKCSDIVTKTLDFRVRGNPCAQNYQYLYGQNGGQAGRDLYVRIGADNPQKVAWMELYINGQKVSLKRNAPYDWARPNTSGDNYLRNLRRGTYTLKCKIKTTCGDIVWKEKRVTVR